MVLRVPNTQSFHSRYLGDWRKETAAVPSQSFGTGPQSAVGRAPDS